MPYDPPRQPRQPYMPNSVTSRPAASTPAPLGAAPHSTAETKIDHLLQAAAHLEAAGFSDQAAEARKKADDHKRALLQRLLDQRLAEVELLKTEIARLQTSPSPASAGGSETIDDDRAVPIRRDRNSPPLPSAGKDGRSKR
ncbi:MAG: hypothetical protein WD847_11755 [Pirellulales bacterium]